MQYAIGTVNSRTGKIAAVEFVEFPYEEADSLERMEETVKWRNKSLIDSGIHLSVYKVVQVSTVQETSTVEIEPRIDLYHPNGTAKTVTEIRQEATRINGQVYKDYKGDKSGEPG